MSTDPFCSITVALNSVMERKARSVSTIASTGGQDDVAVIDRESTVGLCDVENDADWRAVSNEAVTSLRVVGRSNELLNDWDIDLVG